MQAEVRTFCERLNIKFCEDLIPYYEKGKKRYEELGDFIFDKDRLIAYNKKYNIFRAYFDEVLQAADMVRADRDLALHTYILSCMIEDRALLSILEIVNRDRMDTDYAPLYALLYFLDDMIQDMEKRGVPLEIISDTLNGFESEMNDYYDIYGRHGMRRYVGWFMLWIKKEILRIGRLQYQFKDMTDKLRVYRKGDDIRILMDGEEMHPKGMVFGSAGQDQVEEKYVAEITENGDEVTGYEVNWYGECVPQKVTLKGYTEVLRTGAKILSTHIISHEPFTQDLLEKSYQQAIEVMKNCYPEYDYKAICCYSWMMEKRLRQIMGRDTNITLFADKYHAFPLKSAGNGVYAFLYHLPAQVAPEEVPENNSMQRAVKKYLCDGNYFYEKGGLFLVD